MEIVDWQNVAEPVILKNRAPRRFLSPTLIGILGTLLLHALVIQSVPFGGKVLKTKPPQSQQSTDALSKSKGDRSESLVLISLPSRHSSEEIQSFTASLVDLRQMKIKPALQVDLPELPKLETLALNEDQPSSSISQSNDTEEKARLFGIYTGQIQARIDRVWRRPRTPVNENKPLANRSEAFQCDAEIVQDAKGNVQEILLLHCNGSPAWQHSLILAIQHASPLPAPPSDKVFSTSITLNFLGLSYFAGALEDDYVPETRTLVGAR